MSDATVLQIGRDTLSTMLLLMTPVMIITLAIGLTISILQAATQVQEMTLTFVPKLLAAMVAMSVFGPWMMSQLIAFTQRLFAGFPSLIR